MQRFATLLDSLTRLRRATVSWRCSSNISVKHPIPIAALRSALSLAVVFVRCRYGRALTDLMTAKIDPVLYQMSRDYVGDTAETVALLWPNNHELEPAPRLAEVAAAIEATDRSAIAPVIGGFLDRLDVRGRWALLKLLGGAPRVGVSARLAQDGAREMSSHDVSEIEEIWHALVPPYTASLSLARKSWSTP